MSPSSHLHAWLAAAEWTMLRLLQLLLLLLLLRERFLALLIRSTTR